MSTKLGRILIIDDEDYLREIMQKALSLENLVVMADSGLSGQKILKTDRAFDLILCDLSMPDLGGQELHAWLWRLDPDLADKIIFVSGGASPEVMDYLKNFSNLRLEKPFDLSDLQALVLQRLKSGPPLA